ncbi:MAG: hypothetical protein K0S12_537 [Bacteroidetes bacterium]|jgi:hypothetical protein|nr:hypothetical protein [Bacteroidota bacterium]
MSNFNEMKSTAYILSVLLILSCFTFTNCKKKEVPVQYDVILKKKYDSLPCTASIEYRFGTHDPSDTHTEQISSNWSIAKNCTTDEKVTLKAIAVSNLKSVIIKLNADGDSQQSECIVDGCTVYLEKALYDK